MKNLKGISQILLVLIVIGFAIGMARQATAQEGVVRFLKSRFRQQNIHVIKITILNESPLRLQIVVQSKNHFVTVDDMAILNTVDREVFIFAREQGYFIESYVRVLQDNQGRQLDTIDRAISVEQIDSLLVSPSNISDETTLKIATEKISLLLDDYDLRDAPMTVDISSLNGLQTLFLQIETTSLEQANRASFFLWSLPKFSLVLDLNAQGAQIVLYRAKVMNEKEDILFDYLYDFQLKTGGWIQDENLIDLNGAPSSGP